MTRHHVLAGLLAILGLLLLVQRGDGPKRDHGLPLPTTRYQCAECEAEFSLDPNQVRDRVDSGRVVATPGEMLRVECPECNQIEAVEPAPYPEDL